MLSKLSESELEHTVLLKVSPLAGLSTSEMLSDLVRPTGEETNRSIDQGQVSGSDWNCWQVFSDNIKESVFKMSDQSEGLIKKEKIINRFRVNPVNDDEFKKRRSKTDSRKESIKENISPTNSSKLLGMLPLILLMAVVSCFGFALFMVIKLALFSERREKEF